MVSKELIFNSLFLLEDVAVLKELILTVSTLREGVVFFKELNFDSFYLLEDVVVLKEQICISFYFGWVVWS